MHCCGQQNVDLCIEKLNLTLKLGFIFEGFFRVEILDICMLNFAISFFGWEICYKQCILNLFLRCQQ